MNVLENQFHVITWRCFVGMSLTNDLSISICIIAVLIKETNYLDEKATTRTGTIESDNMRKPFGPYILNGKSFSLWFYFV